MMTPSKWLRPNRNTNTKATQCQEELTSGDSGDNDPKSECSSLKLPPSGVVFKASPSRRQVKAVIFERGSDGEPTVTVLMTREKDDADSSNSNSNGSSISSGRNSCFEAATDQRVLRKSFVGQRRGGRSASVTFSVKAAGHDVGNNDAISV
jgi:hypothetical protein